MVFLLPIDYSLTPKDGPTTFWTTTPKAQVTSFDYAKLHQILVYMFMIVKSFVMGTNSD